MTVKELIDAYQRGELDFRNAELSKADLSEADLSEANLSEANLSEANLRKADLREANLTGATLIGAHITGANLARATLTGAHITGAILTGATLESANLVGAHLESVNLESANLARANLTGAHITGANLARANLTGATLTGATLGGANLSEAHLNGAHLEGAKLIGAYLSEAHLEGAHLEGADLEGADLRGANLSKAFLREANLSRANLSGAILDDVRLDAGIFSAREVSDYVFSWRTVARSLHLDGLLDFLVRTGMPNVAATYLIDALKSIDTVDLFTMLQSVFLSYGGPDTTFAERLREDLKNNGVKTWFFPKDAIPGKRLHRHIQTEINRFDRMILCCSVASLQRPGVLHEIEEVLEREQFEGGSEVLIPIMLDDIFASGASTPDWWPADKEHIYLSLKRRVAANFTKASSDLTEWNEQLSRVLVALRKEATSNP